jgi:hypothetical protein
VAVAAKVGWKRVTGVFGGKKHDTEEASTEPAAESPEATPDDGATVANPDA